jgi:Ankyrin repeats (3 copies)
MSDALALPPRPNINQYRKLAKDLQQACKTGDPAAVHDWAARWAETVARLRELPDAGVRREVALDVERIERQWQRLQGLNEHVRRCTLAGAQFLVARCHGFASWPKFAEHLEAMARVNSPVSQFEAAVDAIVGGDIKALKNLLRDDPELVRARSTREHHSTLLHYVSANGVEGYRQKTPKNIVEIADLLLRAGSDVDAGAEVYNSSCTTLGLVATSVHPQKAGVQQPLMQLLLDRGARMDKPGLAGRQTPLVLACFHNGQPEAAKFLADRGAPLDLEAAAGVGRVELVKSFFDADANLRPPATHRQLQNGFLWACECGHDDIAVFLLERGADPLDPADTGATALHWAAGAAHLGLVKLLIQRGAPLEIVNRWGGTVLEHAGHCFEHGPAGLNFVPVFEALLAAGAKIQGSWLKWLETVDSRSVEEKARLAEVLLRYRATE